MTDLRSPWRPGPLALVCLGISAVLIAADWLTPAGIVVGIFLGVPIVLSSISEDRRDIWLVSLFATTGFALAAIFGREPISVREVWVPNRVMAALSLPLSAFAALLMHRQRTCIRTAAREAERTSHLNRLLLSLLAHDLRAPLGMALQAIDYVHTAEKGKDLDEDLIREVGGYLRRSLGTIDGILNLARLPTDPAAASARDLGAGEIAGLLEAEARAFEEQARGRGKELRMDVQVRDEDVYRLDALVPRQVVAILIDNAVRHARPGVIRFTARIESSEIRLRLADEGPGLSGTRGSEQAERGSGLGLELCRALVHQAGGEMTVSHDGPDGTTFDLRLPLGRPVKGAPGGRSTAPPS